MPLCDGVVQKENGSTTQWLFEQMLDRIQQGVWPVGSKLPGERTLMTEFQVSRVPLRESLSMLRALGVLDIGHGRKSLVRQIDSDILGRLFPLMLSMKGPGTFRQVFEVRLAIECQTAYLAAQRRGEEDLVHLDVLVARQGRAIGHSVEEAVEADHEFHETIGQATGNPLFPILLKALSGFVIYAQWQSFEHDMERARQSVAAHGAIVEAIRAQDSQWARAAMEAHLRYAAASVFQNEEAK